MKISDFYKQFKMVEKMINSKTKIILSKYIVKIQNLIKQKKKYMLLCNKGIKI